MGNQCSLIPRRPLAASLPHKIQWQPFQCPCNSWCWGRELGCKACCCLVIFMLEWCCPFILVEAGDLKILGGKGKDFASSISEHAIPGSSGWLGSRLMHRTSFKPNSESALVIAWIQGPDTSRSSLVRSQKHGQNIILRFSHWKHSVNIGLWPNNGLTSCPP